MYLTTLFALTLAAGPAHAAAQAAAPPRQATDARYDAWLGCWDLEVDRLAGRLAPTRLCVVPGEAGGARVLTIRGTDVALTEPFVADGTERQVTSPGCRGTERVEWAATFPGFFRAADVACGTEVTPHRVTSIAFQRTDGSWIDVQAAATTEGIGLRVRRYRRSTDQSVPTSIVASGQAPIAERRVPPAAWTAANLVEASRVLPTEAVEAVVTELDRPVELKKKHLLAMADGGVHERVIDLLVGLTYPERFVVRRGGGGGGSFGGLGAGPYDCDPTDVSLSYPCAWVAWDRFGMWNRDLYGGLWGYYGGYGYGPTSIYGPYDYGYGGGGWGYAGPDTVSPTGRPVREGVVVNGQGYTQVTVRPPAPANFGPQGGGTGGGTSGTNSNAGVSSQGYSSGSAGSGGDRTAVARPPL